MPFWKKAKTWFREDDSIKPRSNSPNAKRKNGKKPEETKISHNFQKIQDPEKSEVFGSCRDVSKIGKYSAQEYVSSGEDVKYEDDDMLENKMHLLVPLSMRQKASMFQSCGSLDDLLAPMKRTESLRHGRVSVSMMPNPVSSRKLVGKRVLEARVSVTLISKEGTNCLKEWNPYYMVLTKNQLILSNWPQKFYQREWPLHNAHIIVCSNYYATDKENEGKTCLLLTILYDQYLIMFDNNNLASQWLMAIQREIYHLGLRTLKNCQQDHYHLFEECDELPGPD